MDPKKLFLTLMIGTGLVACNNNEDYDLGSTTEGVDTYLNLTVSLPTLQKRALPDDYNEDGEYEGEDLIQTLDIYMLNADNSVEAKRFSGTDIATTGTAVSPSQPFRTMSGYKTIYVVLNDPGALKTTIASEDELIDIDGLATIVNQGGTDYDVITMTGKTATTVYIEPDIPVQDVITGTANRFSVEVTRVASRVIVTLDPNADQNLEDEEGNIIGSVSDIYYAVAQGTTKVYWLPQSDFSTYGTTYVPALGTYVDQANTYYDYSGLNEKELVPMNPTTTDGYKSLKGKFLFENVHADGDLRTTDYRKGNTAYVLVTATFTPNADAIADGGTLASNGTFYVGAANGKIYSSKAAATTLPEGEPNQKVITFRSGKMYNYAWLNPDDIERPLNSPVVRNNIYHINITGFRRLSYNWNPLYPEDPNTENPSNPDPKPSPEEPDLPIDPTDPLTPEQTYMTVDITAKNWTVHSYDIEF